MTTRITLFALFVATVYLANWAIGADLTSTWSVSPAGCSPHNPACSAVWHDL